jgi:hypothetical protein
MALAVGNADLGTGLAGAIFAQLKTLPGAQFSGLNSPMAHFANALAQAIVPYITSHAVVPATGLVSATAGSPVTGQTTVT